MKKNKVTIYEVAGKANVSLATVSRVLNYPEKVKTETKERVLAVIKELGYRPNAIARGLASRKSTFVGIVVPDFSRASVAEAVNGIANLANSYGYQILVFPAEGENRKSEDVWADVIASQVDGVLYLNDLVLEDEVSHLKEMMIPIVVTNSVIEDDEIATVNINYEEAAYRITKNLINKGRTSVVLAQTSRLYSMNVEKEKGYVKAMEESGLTPKILRTSGKPEINNKQIKEFLNNNKVDGVIGVRDSIAVAFMNVAIENGYQVPKDLEVYGFQNTRTSLLARPQLSTIDTPTFEMGRVAMEMLTVMMEDGEVTNRQINVPYGIIERGTTK